MIFKTKTEKHSYFGTLITSGLTITLLAVLTLIASQYSSGSQESGSFASVLILGVFAIPLLVIAGFVYALSLVVTGSTTIRKVMGVIVASILLIGTVVYFVNL